MRPLFHGCQDLLFLKIKYWPWLFIHQYCDLSSRWSRVCQVISTSCFPCSNLDGSDPGHRLDHRDGLSVAFSFDICGWSVPTACVASRSWLSSVTSEALQERSVLQRHPHFFFIEKHFSLWMSSAKVLGQPRMLRNMLSSSTYHGRVATIQTSDETIQERKGNCRDGGELS